MVFRTARMGLLLAVLGAGVGGASRGALGAVPTAEDLNGCKLVNGRLTLPGAGTTAAKDGAMYKFASGKFTAVMSADGVAASPEDSIEKTRAQKLADVQYLPERGGGGSLLVFSGSYAAVPGAQYLSDVPGLKKMPDVWDIPKVGKNLAGEYPDIQEGAVYLIKCTDGNYALLRVLDKQPTAVVLQFVYQPDGSTKFDIPINNPVPYRRPVEANPASSQPATAVGPGASATSASAPYVDLIAGGAEPWRTPTPVAPVPGHVGEIDTHLQLGPGDVNEPGRIVLISGGTSTGSSKGPGLEPSMGTFKSQRMQMLQRRLDIIAAPAKTAEEIEKKAQAVADLTSLHADEAIVANELVRQISFLHSRNATEFTPDAQNPCYVALKQMGLPGANAALKGIQELDLNAPGEQTESPVYKAKLLGQVIRDVEGNDVAEFVFKRELERAVDPKRKAVFEFLLGK